MKKVFLIGAAASGLLSAVPAQAAEIFYCGLDAPSGSSCVDGTDNVLLNSANGVGSTTSNPVQPVGIGMVGNTQVRFTTTELQGLDLDANGQAKITAHDGILNNLTWSLVNASFGIAEFNLIDLRNQDFNVTIDALNSGGIQTTATYFATNNGSNRFGVMAGVGELITGVTINSADGFGSFRQLRVAGITAAVPEPASWALMLVGFGFLGGSMRRKRPKIASRVNFA